MENTKQQKIWLVTFLDLVMIMTCFFVLIYAVTLKKNNSNKEQGFSTHPPFVAQRNLNSGSLRMIHHMLAQHLGDSVNKINISYYEDKLRIDPCNIVDHKEQMLALGKELGCYLFNFTRNLIKVSLLLDLTRVQQEALIEHISTEEKIVMLIECVNLFRNRLSHYSRNNGILTAIEIVNSAPATDGKSWNIVTYIYPESKYKQNEIN
ncbi:MAG: hypothetical protein EB127_06820 [Alphaproteobacteria bacterium]|nr:hypothetical protein [Alphaproteobacteria bacterium]